MMTDEQLRNLSSTWLSPIDLVLADLLDKSERMTIGAFNAEVEKVVAAIPQMFGMLDRQAFIDALEDQIGAAMLKGLER
jgi:hypothetical protein